jgi:hypothetical protein
VLERHLDERLCRMVAAAEAEALGPRGISVVSESIRRWWRRMGRPLYRATRGS